MSNKKKRKSKKRVPEKRLTNPTRDEALYYIQTHNIEFGNNGQHKLDEKCVEAAYQYMKDNNIPLAPFMFAYQNKSDQFAVRRAYAEFWNNYYNHTFHPNGKDEGDFCGFHNGSAGVSESTLFEYGTGYGISRLTFGIDESIDKALHYCKSTKGAVRSEAVITEWLKQYDKKLIANAQYIMKQLGLPIDGGYFAAKVYKDFMIPELYDKAQYTKKQQVESKTDVVIFTKDGTVCKGLSLKYGKSYQICSMQVKELRVYGETLKWKDNESYIKYMKLMDNLIIYDPTYKPTTEEKKQYDILFKQHFHDLDVLLTENDLWEQFYRYAITGENKFNHNSKAIADTVVNIRKDNSILIYTIDDYINNVMYEYSTKGFSKKSSCNKGSETLRILINH